MKTDSSEWCIDSTLMQYNNNELLQSCAYFLKKNSSAECNYKIYNKEMLVIVCCLDEWDAELRSVEHFEIWSDHKNLEYFMSVQKLTERQMRWLLTLFKYNFIISYISRKTNKQADVLSHQEQDMPKDIDARVDKCMMQLLKS